MKIIELLVENVRKVKAVQIFADQVMNIISGKNSQGKSSVLDSIWYALGGADSYKDVPKLIRDGEESASVTIKLDDYDVTRTWNSKGKSTLKVTTKDGAVFPSPQGLLDKMVGNISFDPLGFMKLMDKEQVQTLAKLVKVEPNPVSIDTQIEMIYIERRDLNRDISKYKTLLKDLPEPDINLPDEEIDTMELMEKKQEINKIIADKKLQLSVLKNEFDSIERSKESLTLMDKQVEDLKEQIRSISKRKENYLNEVQSREEAYNVKKKSIESIQVPSSDEIDDQIATANNVNPKIRARNKRAEIENNLGDLVVDADQKTLEIEELQKTKADALAKAKFPIEGLSFDANYVMFNGIPLKQCSESEKLKVGMSIAMAINPEIKVIRICDGSLLDKENMELIKHIAMEKDYQIWIERVEDDQPQSIIIEDGEINDSKAEVLETKELAKA